MFKYFTFFILTFIIITGCSRVEGCKDKYARNYNSEATKDCKCCKYEGTVVFWYTKSVADILQSQGSSSLNYYVDEQLMLSGVQNFAWSYPPECGQKTSATITKDLGGDKNKSFSYRIEDANGNDIWIGTQTFEGNNCIKIELYK